MISALYAEVSTLVFDERFINIHSRNLGIPLLYNSLDHILDNVGRMDKRMDFDDLEDLKLKLKPYGPHAISLVLLGYLIPSFSDLETLHKWIKTSSLEDITVRLDKLIPDRDPLQNLVTFKEDMKNTYPYNYTCENVDELSFACSIHDPEDSKISPDKYLILGSKRDINRGLIISTFFDHLTLDKILEMIRRAPRLYEDSIKAYAWKCEQVTNSESFIRRAYCRNDKLFTILTYEGQDSTLSSISVYNRVRDGRMLDIDFLPSNGHFKFSPNIPSGVGYDKIFWDGFYIPEPVNSEVSDDIKKVVDRDYVDGFRKLLLETLLSNCGL